MAETQTWRDTVEVSAIVLNPENYRHRTVQSQEECFAALFTADSKDHMLELASDIASRGLDPSDLPILEPVNEYFRVVEGNRRFACIKAMGNSALIPDISGVSPARMASYRRSFERLGEATELPGEVFCTVSTDQDAINHWTRLRHLPVGSHKGAGRMLWDTEGRTRMEQALAGPGAGRTGASNTQTADALAIMDGLIAQFPQDVELLALIERAKRNKLTTIGRLMVNPENHVLLGIALENDGVRFLVSPDAVRKIWHKILTDAVENDLTARRINKADDVRNYINDGLKHQLPTAGDRLSAPINPAARGGAAETAVPTKGTAAKRAKIAPPERRPFRGLKLRHASEKTKKLLGELQKLTFEGSPYTIAVLNRTLIDLYTWDVMEHLDPKRNVPDSPSVRMLRILGIIEPPSTKPKQRKFPLISNATEKNVGDLAIDTMNGYMHRSAWHPTPDIVRRQSSEYMPFLAALDEMVEQKLLAASTNP